MKWRTGFREEHVLSDFPAFKKKKKISFFHKHSWFSWLTKKASVKVWATKRKIDFVSVSFWRLFAVFQGLDDNTLEFQWIAVVVNGYVELLNWWEKLSCLLIQKNGYLDSSLRDIIQFVTKLLYMWCCWRFNCDVKLLSEAFLSFGHIIWLSG